MSDRPESPASVICRESEEHARALDKIANEHLETATPELLGRLARAVALQSRMIVPLYRSYYNGGLPAKKAGKTFTIQTSLGTLNLHSSTVATWVFRGLILWMLGKSGVSPDALRSAIKTAFEQELKMEVAK